MNDNDKLKYTFVFGAVVDGLIAVSWMLIALGSDMPSVVSGHHGSGEDYRFAMYACAMFMFGWGVILAWGAVAPGARKDLLIITASLLFLSVIVELTAYADILSGPVMLFGVVKRLFLVTLFCYVYFTSSQTS